MKLEMPYTPPIHFTSTNRAGSRKNISSGVSTSIMGVRIQAQKKRKIGKKDNSLTNTTKMRLYCLDKLFDNTLNIDLKEILTSSIIQAVCLIEDIRNNRITFTNHPNWKSRIKQYTQCIQSS